MSAVLDRLLQWIGRAALAWRRFWIHRRILKGGLRHARFNSDGIVFSYYHSSPEAAAQNANSRKPALILLHGFLDSAHTWRRLFAELGERYTIYAVDMPGFGQTHYPPIRELWHMQAIARGLARFLFLHDDPENQDRQHDYTKQSAGLGLRDATVLTHSMGGLMALQMALRTDSLLVPEDSIRELHLIAPGALKLPAAERDEVRRKVFPRTEAEVLELVKRLHSGNPPQLGRSVIRGLLHEWSRPGYELLAENTIANEDAAFFQPAQIAKLKRPLYLYWGDADHITDISIARKIKRARPRTKLEVFPGAGHALHLQRAREFLDAFWKNAGT